MSLQGMSDRRRTKIICTIGPATSSEHWLEMLIAAGMDCARLNFSHGLPRDHLKVINLVRRISRRTGKHIAVLQDLPGPKFRVGDIIGGSIQVKKGSILTLTSKKETGMNQIPLRSKELPLFAPKGGRIFLSDGSIRLRVLSTTRTDIECRCEIGGTLFSGKGINVPDLKKGFQTFTTTDKKFLAFGLEHGVDLVAVSFVRRSSDIDAVRNFMRKRSKSVPIIAKIEKKEAVDNIEGIVRSADALMVARGDLGVENPLEQIPELQKRIISRRTESADPAITATQKLESMVYNPSPTRAEVTDVANAKFDGTDAVMLSEETAVGRFPVECVDMLNKVSINAERRMRATRQFGSLDYSGLGEDIVSDAVGRAATAISNQLGAKAIITFLDSLDVVCKISRLKPIAPVVAISENQANLRRLMIVWGVYPLIVKMIDGDATTSAVKNLTNEKFLRENEKSILVCLDQGSSRIPTMRMQVTRT